MKQWQTLMAAEEKRTGLAPGTLASLVQQETGGQQRFIDNPGDFHYKVGPKGEKPKSTARGLGGILEATARDPGYGVTPLKDWSAPEQLRFIADYAQARIKQAGSVAGGLAGYGEGGKYAQQVTARMGKGAPVPVAPVVPAPAAPVLHGGVPVVTEAPQMVQAPVAQDNPWGEFQQALPSQPVQVADLNYGVPQTRADNFSLLASLDQAAMQPNFNMFGKWKGKA